MTRPCLQWYENILKCQRSNENLDMNSSVNDVLVRFDLQLFKVDRVFDLAVAVRFKHVISIDSKVNVSDSVLLCIDDHADLGFSKFHATTMGYDDLGRISGFCEIQLTIPKRCCVITLHITGVSWLVFYYYCAVLLFAAMAISNIDIYFLLYVWSWLCLAGLSVLKKY